MNPGMVVKLRPSGPWRIGPDSGARNRVDAIYHSDTLYAAVTSAMAALGSREEWLDATARASAPAVRFSSCFPFVEEIGFVAPPRTVWPPSSPGLMAARVRWKSARFVPLGIVQAILAGERLDDGHWTVDGPSECLLPIGRTGPFRSGVRWNAAVDRLSGASERHSTACLEFRPGAGLWTIVSFADQTARETWSVPVKAAFRWLADSGFGGERSRGWGRSEAPEFVEGVLPEMILGTPQGAAVQAPVAVEEPAAAVEAEPLPAAGERPAAEGAADAGEQASAPSAESPADKAADAAPVSAEETVAPPLLEAPAGAAGSGEPASAEATPEEPVTEVAPGKEGASQIAEPATAASDEPAAAEATPEEPVTEVAPGEEGASRIAEAPAEAPASGEAATGAKPEAATTEAAPVEEAAPSPSEAAEGPQSGEPSSSDVGPAPASDASVIARPELMASLAPARPPAAAPAAAFWLLSLYTPAVDDAVDWARGDYTLTTRGGRVDSSGELKKQLPMIAEGSVLYAASEPRGSATDVAPDGFAHPVFRAGFAVSIPLPEARQ